MAAVSEAETPVARTAAEAPGPAPTRAAARPADIAPAGRAAEPRNRHARKWSIGVVLLLVAGCALFLWWDNARHFEVTDDAFIATRTFAVAPQISGTLVAVPVTDNQHVAAGQAIARIDDRDYRAAVAAATAAVEAAQASVASAEAQADVQEAQVAGEASTVRARQASLIFAREQAARYGRLASEGYGTTQNAQQYRSQQNQGEAALQSAQSALIAAGRQLAVLKAQKSSAEAGLAQARAKLQQATLNLSYTTITAAQPGRIAQLSAAVGQYVQPGTALAMFVPDKVWVTANFEETQLTHMHPGDPVSINVDAYPGHAIEGHVASVQPGSGTAFSLLPAENATGNYVKVIQRVPVKIVLGDVPVGWVLGPGMSVEPTVRINPHLSFLERLERLW